MKLTDKYPIIYCLSVMILLSGCATKIPKQFKQNATVDNPKYAYAVEGTGEAIVVFEAGWDFLGMDTWAPVFSDVAAFSTVFAFLPSTRSSVMLTA